MIGGDGVTTEKLYEYFAGQRRPPTHPKFFGYSKDCSAACQALRVLYTEQTILQQSTPMDLSGS